VTADRDWTRRELIKVAAGVVAVGPLIRADEALRLAAVVRERIARGAPPLFFTPAEFAQVDELTELIIPTDDHSPGARAAQVAAYIDASLAEALEGERRQTWRSGLQGVDALAREMYGKPFLEATPTERNAVLARMARNESQPAKPEEKFFKELKERTVRAYYTSNIGIHAEMEYKGNTSLGEFAGYDAK
jgi:hypothetical protein